MAARLREERVRSGEDARNCSKLTRILRGKFASELHSRATSNGRLVDSGDTEAEKATNEGAARSERHDARPKVHVG